MNVAITARHCEISEELQVRAREVAERLAGVADRPVEATVIFDRGNGRAVAEIRIVVPGATHVASADAADHRTALDRAEEKIRRQLARGTSAPRGRRTTGAA